MKIKTNVSGRFHWAKRIIVLFATLFLIMSCGDSSDDGGGTTGGTGDDGGGVATTIDGVWKVTSFTTCNKDDGSDNVQEPPLDVETNTGTITIENFYVQIINGKVGYYFIISGQTLGCDDITTFTVVDSEITDSEQNGFTFITVDDTITITADEDCATQALQEIELTKASSTDIANPLDSCALIEGFLDGM